MQVGFDRVLGDLESMAVVFDLRLELQRESDATHLLRVAASTCDENIEALTCDYGAYVFIRTQVSSSDLVAFLRQISEASPALQVPGGVDEVICDWTSDQMQFDFQTLARGQWYGFRKRSYPAKFYQCNRDVGRGVQVGVNEALNAYGLPYFPSLIAAETYFLFDAILDNSNPTRNVLQIVVDDKRAWFEKIVVGDAGLTIFVGGRLVEDCEVKIYARRPGFVCVIRASEVIEHGIPLETLPAEMNVYLTLGDIVLDQRFLSDNPSIYSPTEDVYFERDEKVSIEGIIRLRGEGLHHDYKEQYTHKICDTMCAFANTEGGSILVGITDDGDVVGVDDPDEVRLTIENYVEDHVIGTIARSYYFHAMKDTIGNEEMVLEVRVTEAETKPVAIRDKDREKYFIRRDGSNRVMRREDFVSLLSRAVRKAGATPSLYANPFHWGG